MNKTLAASTLGLAFALSGQAGQDQAKEPTPEQKERIMVAQACNRIASTVIPPESRTAHTYAVQGCVYGYYTAKQALPYIHKLSR